MKKILLMILLSVATLVTMGQEKTYEYKYNPNTRKMDWVRSDVGGGGTSYWTKDDDDNLYYIDGSVGFGTETPYYSIDVSGGIRSYLYVFEDSLSHIKSNDYYLEIVSNGDTIMLDAGFVKAFANMLIEDSLYADYVKAIYNLIVNDTAFISVLLADQIGGGVAELNVDGEAMIDTLYTPIDTATSVLDGLLVSDGADEQIKWLPWDSLPSGGGSDTDWITHSRTMINDTANTDAVAVPDGIFEVGSRDLNDGKIRVHTGNYAIDPIEIYNANNKLVIDKDIMVGGTNTSGYPGIDANDNPATGEALFRNVIADNTGVGGDEDVGVEQIYSGTVVTQANTTQFKVNEPLQVASSDTSTAILGAIVFIAADSSFWGCRSTVANKKWYKLSFE